MLPARPPGAPALRAACWLMLAMYLLLLGRVIVFKEFPLHAIGWLLRTVRPGGQEVNLRPGATLAFILFGGGFSTTSKVLNIAGNVLLFAPLGAALPALMTPLRGRLRVALVVFDVSLALEMTQYLLGIGVADVDDLLLNTLGGVLGYAAYRRAQGRSGGVALALALSLMAGGMASMAFFYRIY